ncbi:MAG: IS21 family transposase [Anaerolineales bacterium]|nr:MAG: IS21 family transposase [Anaerolineales bacterium]
MMTVETVLKVRLARRDGQSVRGIAKKYRLSRNTVRKYLRGDEVEPRYQRQQQVKPKLGPFLAELEQLLAEDLERPVRERRNALMLFEELQRRGYQGAYNSVCRHAKAWKAERRAISDVFIPLRFEPAEAFQFDWGEETLIIGGRTTKVSIAHLRLCHSRLPICVAYLRQSLEMVMDAHRQAFSFFGGVCRRGIYDNMKTVVSKILLGKERTFNPRFLAMASHYLFEPVACTPAAGWEKGQVENQVGLARTRFFSQRRRFEDMAEVNEFLLSECLAWAKTHPHPEDSTRTIWEVWEQEERPRLIQMDLAFDGFVEREVRVSTTSLVAFDRNHYSVDAARAKRTAQVRAYADRVVVLSGGQVVGEHGRQFGRDKTIYNPWHYLPVLERKPGALRNGAPFQDWDLPAPIQTVWSELKERPGGDREFVDLLNAIKTHGCEAVEKAASEAIVLGAVSFDVIFNLLSRQTEAPPASSTEQLPEHLTLRHLPLADCSRYDRLLEGGSHAS